jgi:hypothetical protein
VSLTVIWNVTGPALGGVPDNAPVALFSVSQAGSPAALNVKTALPPIACTTVLFGAFAVAGGNGELVTNIRPGVASTGSVRLPVVKAPSESVTVTSNDTLAGVFTGGVPLSAPAPDRVNHEGRLAEVQV